MSGGYAGGAVGVQRLAVTTAGYEAALKATPRKTRSGATQVGVYGVTSFYLQATNLGANPIRLYFSEGDFSADTDYILLPAPSSPGAREVGSQWEGPASERRLWVKSTSGDSTLELVNYQRLG